jgi:phosphonate transport system substrate-binding protein
MTTRRRLLAAPLLAAPAIVTLTGLSRAARAAPAWAAKYPELVYAMVPAENATGLSERTAPFVAYLSETLGVPVKLRIANDYAAVIEGQKTETVQIGYYGPAAYARAVMIGAKIQPFIIDVYAASGLGYYSAFYVRADSPYRTIADLKGKNMGFVDPNSMSGTLMPRYALHKMGIDPDTYFGKIIYTGSHENGILALKQGTVDVATNWWDSDNESNLTRMVTKGMVKKEDYRVILKSDLIINSPHAYLTDMPEEAKAAIRTAFLEAPTKAPAAFARLQDGQALPWQPIDAKAYEPTIELVKYIDSLRKKG